MSGYSDSMSCQPDDAQFEDCGIEQLRRCVTPPLWDAGLSEAEVSDDKDSCDDNEVPWSTVALHFSSGRMS